MKKVAGILFLIVFFGLPIQAQQFSLVAPPPPDLTPHLGKIHFSKPTRTKFSLGGGYMYRSLLEADAHRENMSGFNLYADYALLRWLSIGADLSGGYNISRVNGNTQIYTLMFGGRIYPFGHKHKLIPFAQVLAGPAFSVFNLESQGGFPVNDYWSHAGVFMGGAGLDVRYKKRWTIRLIELDYEETHFYNIVNSPGGFYSGGQGNYRGSVGIIYHFGVK
jgi:hypothetical protein